jgi:hypothetical protein
MNESCIDLTLREHPIDENIIPKQMTKNLKENTNLGGRV